MSPTTGQDGIELWTSDGTEAGTTIVKDINAGGGASSFADNLVDVGGTLFFTARDTTDFTLRQLWTSDGTEAGTTLVKEFVPGPPG